MKINRNKLIIVFSIIAVGIIGLSIAYAALSTTLNITGSGSVNAAGWGLEIVKFSEFNKEYVCQNYLCGDYFAYMLELK